MCLKWTKNGISELQTYSSCTVLSHSAVSRYFWVFCPALNAGVLMLSLFIYFQRYNTVQKISLKLQSKFRPLYLLVHVSAYNKRRFIKPWQYTNLLLSDHFPSKHTGKMNHSNPCHTNVYREGGRQGGLAARNARVTLNVHLKNLNCMMAWWNLLSMLSIVKLFALSWWKLEWVHALLVLVHILILAEWCHGINVSYLLRFITTTA